MGAPNVKVLPAQRGELLVATGGGQEIEPMFVFVKPVTGQPEPSRISGLLPCSKVLPEI